MNLTKSNRIDEEPTELDGGQRGDALTRSEVKAVLRGLVSATDATPELVAALANEAKAALAKPLNTRGLARIGQITAGLARVRLDAATRLADIDAPKAGLTVNVGVSVGGDASRGVEVARRFIDAEQTRAERLGAPESCATTPNNETGLNQTPGVEPSKA